MYLHLLLSLNSPEIFLIVFLANSLPVYLYNIIIDKQIIPGMFSFRYLEAGSAIHMLGKKLSKIYYFSKTKQGATVKNFSLWQHLPAE